MVMVLWASPPASSGNHRKREERLAETILLRWWLIFYEIMPTVFYAPVGTIEGDWHTKDLVS